MYHYKLVSTPVGELKLVRAIADSQAYSGKTTTRTARAFCRKRATSRIRS